MTETKNAVIGQSGGPTAAINATLAGVIAGCLAENTSIDRVYGMRHGIEGFMNEELVELNSRFAQNRDEELRLLSLTPAAALGSCRVKLVEEKQFEKIFAVLEAYNIGYFFYIGGNDSMDAVAKLEAYRDKHPAVNPTGTRFIGVPKTIDNDLCFTDHTPGFGSAAKYIASSLAEIARDCAVYRQKAVTVVELMGRDAGWLTAAAGLTKEIAGIGADLIYLPEVPFDAERFLNDVMNKLNIPGKNFVLVAVSEGIRNKDGDYVAKAAMSGVVDIFGHAYLSGTGKYLENLIRDEIGCKCRSVELSVLQRCASHLASKTDIEESLLIGREAVKAAVSGKSGRMMAFVRKNADGSAPYEIGVTDVDVSASANRVKIVPNEFITPDGKGVTRQCIDYLMPLIKGECETVYANGIPQHFTL